MPKTKTKDQKKQAETKALWKTTTLYIVFGSLLFALFWWARNDGESDAAWKVRNLLGIQLLQTNDVAEPAPEPEPKPVPPVVEAEPPTPPEPEPSGEIAFEEPPAPEPESITWSEFRNRQTLRPKTLKIMVDQEVTLTYRGKSYGEITFQSGQPLTVMELSTNGYVFGRSGGNELEIHVSETNFDTWFANEHGESYEISVPEKETNPKADDFEEQLITELRIWCLKNYKTPLIEIKEDHLVLNWHPRSRGEDEANYSLEAVSVARAYLRIQAELGGNDNYASCEIRDPDTGQLLGSKGIFIPRF